ncbi:short chain dehydrogenase [Allonocardiopsis opalescens]|uniref:NAD(P)-dependent dehydrogenase (Short-subunit alcohol dehydrogenase family) n=1 Tax=Allonocardiopsis opalescens TaxID=1144618 RepID=A0A2T0Q564_9ACTN|nr:short chain dehydrogenase [Allonocardiopsis opalescens]PRX98910.1 NAD(P)-dependent dehydrogenase (short-subunit alcohol dehydrogenase family) [Allonocardiopsis opalescens]
MKVIVVGASGTIGGAVARDLAERGHEVVRASRGGPVRVDLESTPSIDALFDTVPDADAVVCCAASAPLAPLVDASDAEFTRGLPGKLLGQVALARRALRRLPDGGSVTLTSGAFTEPTPGSAFGALVNAGLDAFVRTAAAEAPRGLRLNAVSPGWVRESLVAMGLDGGAGTPAAEVARAYTLLVEGTGRGEVARPGAEP